VGRLQAFDHIIALNQNGAIIEQGSFENLKAHPEYINNALASPVEVEQNIEEADEVKVPAPKVDESEDANRQTGDWTVYAYYFKATGWLNASFTLGMATVNGFCVVFSSM